MLSSGEYYVTALSNAFLTVPHQDVICEVAWAKTGEKNGKLFFELSSEAKKVLSDIHEGKLNPLTVFLPKKQPSIDPEEIPDQDHATFAGFGMLDFPKGPGGQKNVKKFLDSLPAEYDKKGIRIYNKDGVFKLGTNQYKWTSLITRACIYFEISGFCEAKLTGHQHSKAVFNQLERSLDHF